jgi:hypothetical protein
MIFEIFNLWGVDWLQLAMISYLMTLSLPIASLLMSSNASEIPRKSCCKRLPDHAARINGAIRST